MRESRLKLKARGKPHYKLLEEGLHLSYRKPKTGAGEWVVRLYGGEDYKVEIIELADDLSDANDATVLSFDQAQKRPRGRRDERDRKSSRQDRTIHRRRCDGPLPRLPGK